MKSLLAAALLFPTFALADGLIVANPIVPLAPPNAVTHAAFMTLTNPTDEAQQIVGVRAEGYMMAHIHMSEIKNDVATMSAVDMIEIAPGQTVRLKHGGLHLMLMRPMQANAEGDSVAITFAFADGSTQVIDAMVMKMAHGT